MLNLQKLKRLANQLVPKQQKQPQHMVNLFNNIKTRKLDKIIKDLKEFNQVLVNQKEEDRKRLKRHSQLMKNKSTLQSKTNKKFLSLMKNIWIN
jgi:hypothetical protein